MKLPPLVPELNVVSLARSLDFYLGILGFHVEFDRPEEKFSMISREGAWIMLEETDALRAVSPEEFVSKRLWRTGDLEYPFGRGINFQIVVSDVQKVYHHVLSKDYEIKVPLEDKTYRAKTELIKVKQFLLTDPDGYLLRIQQRISSTH